MVRIREKLILEEGRPSFDGPAVRARVKGDFGMISGIEPLRVILGLVLGRLPLFMIAWHNDLSLEETAE